MKRILMLVCFLFLMLCLYACQAPNDTPPYEPISKIVYETNEFLPHPETPAAQSLKIVEGETVTLYPSWPPRKKTLDGVCAERLWEQIRMLQPTGERVERLCESTDEESLAREDALRGVMWIEADDTIYRVSADRTSVCMVEDYFSEGELCSAPDDFFKILREERVFAPNNYYYGTWENGELTLQIRHEAPTDVTLTVKDFWIGREDRDEKNGAMVEIVSAVDGEYTIRVSADYSSDHILDVYSQTVQLKAGEPVTVVLPFHDPWFDFEFYVGIDDSSTSFQVRLP